MKAMIVKDFGEANVFEMAEVAKPSITPGHVIVKIKASSVNTVDTMIRQMGPELPLSPKAPAILGMDFAGVVEQVSSDVTQFKVGDEVYGCAGGLADLAGALAEFMLVDTDLISHKPKNLSFKQAAALPLVGITAYEGLSRAGISAGQSVLVHGGSGGVGHVAIQLAKYFGAEVYSTGGGDKQLELIQSLGATGINYKTQSVQQYVEQYTQNTGFDIVFDSVGGANMLNSFDAARLNGQVASTVSLLEIDLSTAHFKGLSLHVVFMLIPMLHNIGRQNHAKILAELTKIAEEGKLTPVLDEMDYSFTDVASAHKRLESSQAMGKIVVEINND